jgi:hypothetical protein
MVFTYTELRRYVVGDRRVVEGTFSNAEASTGGDIVTGLGRVENVTLQHTGAAVVLSAPVVNETLPMNSGDVTIVTVADTAGTYRAIGY